MLLVIAQAWGTEPDKWIGRLVKLVNNPEVIYAGEPVGGVEVIAMSHIDAPFTILVRISQEKVKQQTVSVLAEPSTEPWRAQWQAITNALTAAGHEGDGKQMLATAGQIMGATWDHPNKVSAEDAQKVLAAVRDDSHQGRCSIEPSGDLVVTCKQGPNEYRKHYIGQATDVAWVSTQIESVDVSIYHTRVVIKPEAIIPEIDLQGGKQ